MKKNFIFFVSFVFFLGCSFKALGQEELTEIKSVSLSHDEIVAKINSVVQKIYDQAMASKEGSKELVDFDEKCLSKNADGFLTISYETQIPASYGKTALYAFKLDVEPAKAKTYVSHAGYLNYPMPLLDLQFSGYIIKNPLRRQFDVAGELKKYTEELADYQQQFMPLRFMIIPEKDTYHVREPICFRAVLANVSKGNLLVHPLSKETLFFTLNHAFWGTSPTGIPEVLSPKELKQKQRVEARQARAEAREAKQKSREIAYRLKHNLGLPTVIGKQTMLKDKIILRADEGVSLDFVGEGYKRAQDVEIRGIYLENTNGIKPTFKTTLKIIE